MTELLKLVTLVPRKQSAIGQLLKAERRVRVRGRARCLQFPAVAIESRGCKFEGLVAMDEDQTHELDVDSSALKGPVTKCKNGNDDLDRRKI
jgi:hypothetical protein